MTQVETTPKLYVGTYKKYNEGSLFGEWLTLTDYSDADDFFQKIYDLMEVLEKIENYSDDEWVGLHNQYCQNENYSDDEIYSFDEDFFETFFEGKPMEAARATAFGDVNWSDDYIKFNGYGNLVSINKWSIDNYIDKDAIMRDIAENPENYDL